MNRRPGASRGRTEAKRKKTPHAEHALQGDPEVFGKRNPGEMVIHSRGSGSRRPDSEYCDGEDTALLVLSATRHSVPSRSSGRKEGADVPRRTFSRKEGGS